MRLFVKISSIVPIGVIRSYERMLTYAGMGDVSPRAFIGYSLTLAAFVSAIVFVASFIAFAFDAFLSMMFAGAFFVIMSSMSYVYLNVVADSRAHEIEKVLPDVLQLVSANIQAGMTIDNALWLCAKPEFGEFEEEIQRMAAQTLAGKTLIEALHDLSLRVHSVIVDRAVMLLIQGIQLGGEIAHLLVQIAADIRTSQALRNEINAATAMYSLFIMFASVLAAPALFAVSSFYVETTSLLWGSRVGGMGASEASMSVLQLKGASISPDDVKLFAILAIIITTFFASLLMGLINSGEAKKGLKFMPFFILGALGVHFIGYSVIKSLFGSII